MAVSNNLACHVLALSTFRMTEFTFLVDKNRETPTVTFTGEDPYLQYVSYVTAYSLL